MSRLASMAAGVLGRRAAARFEQATVSVAETQSRKLQEILERNASTEYGREHHFRSVKDLKGYAKHVPIVSYEDIAALVQRMAAGEADVLTAETPVMFSRTSGTTGEPKLVPVTPTCQGRDHADQMRTWLYHARRDHPRVLQGQVISLVSLAVEGHTKSGIPYGSTSGTIYRDMPRLVRSTYALPYEVFGIEDYDARYYAVLRLGLAADVTMFCTANPSSIVKLCEFGQEHAEGLIRDVRDGKLDFELKLAEHERALLQKRCKADPARAAELDKLRKRRDGRLLPADFWPNLAMIGTWKGGTVGSYLESFGEWFDPDGKRPPAVRDLGWLSSEARGSVPLSDEGSAGVLTVGTNVYEFVEADTVEAHPGQPSRWQFLGAHEVDAPRDYYVFVTTTGGLYRYDLNDIVRVLGFHNQAPLVEFQRKGRGMTSITGEKLSDAQVLEAFKVATAKTKVTLAHFRALAEQESAHYVFQVEAKGKLSETQGRELLRALDESLSELNLEYAGKRKSQRLEPPELEIMKPGWYEQGKQAQGGRLFQSKTVILQATPEGEEDPLRKPDMCLTRITLDAQPSRAK